MQLATIDIASLSDALVSSSPMLWTFSTLPPETAVIEAIGRALLAEAGADFAVLHTSDDPSWTLAAKDRSWFTRAGTKPRLNTEPGAAAPPLPPGTRAVLVLAPADAAAAIVRSLPADVRIFGGAELARKAFSDAAGIRANGVRTPLLGGTNVASPDYAAAHASDAVSLLIAAIRTAGLNRRAIRDALQRLSPFTGVSGEIRWDETGRNRRAVRVGTIAGGRVQ
jgi:ABC-type branched-subunit amino acid transport system substrate-binding protein